VKRNPKSPMEPMEGERRGGRKKERERRKKEGRGPPGGPVMLNGLG
jgi:hypothetical protein